MAFKHLTCCCHELKYSLFQKTEVVLSSLSWLDLDVYVGGQGVRGATACWQNLSSTSKIIFCIQDFLLALLSWGWETFTDWLRCFEDGRQVSTETNRISHLNFWSIALFRPQIEKHIDEILSCCFLKSVVKAWCTNVESGLLILTFFRSWNYWPHSILMLSRSLLRTRMLLYECAWVSDIRKVT